VAGSLRRAVFLDRDGTLHRELTLAPREPSEIELFEGTAEALRELARAGFALVVVTNQSAIARGEASWDEVRRVHEHLAQLLPIEAFYVCPHHPDCGLAPYRRACACRKPAAGMLRLASRERRLDPTRSWMVGDARRDVAAGLAAGARAVLVETGKGSRERGLLDAEPSARTLVTADLRAAAQQILRAG